MNDERLPRLAPEGAEPSMHVLPVRFVGSGSEYFRIWIVNLLLTLVTLSLYYPFAKVRRLRYFHGATEVGGHPLAFHADPWKMLRGYVLVALMLAAYSGAGQFSVTAGAIAFVLVAALWPALWHSSLRFRLANTSWRGLRFRYTGTRAQAYAVMGLALVLSGLVVAGALLPEPGKPPADPAPLPPGPPDFADVAPTLLPLLMLMLAMPLMFWLLRRQQHRHYAWGSEQTGFAVGLGRVYLLTLKSLGVTVLAGVLLFGLAVGLVAALGLFASGSQPNAAVPLGVALGLLGYVFLYALAGGFFTARMQNLVWNGTATPHIRIDSRLKARHLVWLWTKNTVLVVLTLGLYFPFAAVASARMRLQAVTLTASSDPALIAAVAASTDEAAAGDAAGDLFGIDIGL